MTRVRLYSSSHLIENFWCIAAAVQNVFPGQADTSTSSHAKEQMVWWHPLRLQWSNDVVYLWIACRWLHANGAKRRSLAKSLNSFGKQFAITQCAMIAASWIADSVDAASILKPRLQILHIIQLAKQNNANDGLQSNRASAPMHHAFITELKSIPGSWTTRVRQHSSREKSLIFQRSVANASSKSIM